MVYGSSKLATQWFGDNERAMATTIGSLSLPFGTIIGFALGTLYISEDDKNYPERGRENVVKYLLFTAIQVTCMCLPLLILQKSRPEHFPSESAKDQS